MRTCAAAANARANGAVITFDPDIRPTLITEPELTRKRILDLVAPMSSSSRTRRRPGSSLTQTSTWSSTRCWCGGPAVVAVTRGENGSVLSSGSVRIECRPAPVVAVDTIGAGDTFMAALIAGVLRQPIDTQAPVPEDWLRAAAASASNAAAIAVSRKGADLPWAHELTGATDRTQLA